MAKSAPWRCSSIPELFDEVARAHAHRPALTDGDTLLTYAEVQAQANRLAHRLRALGVEHETPVATLAERSPELIIALLAILKAGGAYVPLDVQAPAERLAHVLRDTAAPLVITSHALSSQLPPTGASVLVLEDEFATLGSEDDCAPPAVSGPESLAYIMYTSGSTGVPKGALIEHRAVTRLVRDQDYIAFDPAQVFLALAPLSFDASTLEIWGALLNGGTLATMRAEIPSLADIGAAIRLFGVTTLWLTSGLFNAMVDQQLEALAEVRQVLAGGDVLSRKHVRKFLHGAPRSVLVNGYGPTEATTFTCCYPVPREHPEEAVPIGRPLNNTQVYIVGEDGELAADGESGELWIGGDGVARGYLNAPEVTREKFVDGRYRTGDLVRRRGDGVLEFLGRADRQIKMRGFRIEPGEIEAAINRIGGVRDSVVGVDERGGEKRLVAWVAGTVDAGELRSRLASTLPAYMVPTQFVAVERIPLTVNGKVDRERLPRPVAAKGAAAVAGGLQGTLAAIWRAVLDMDAPLDENFFDLGGSSLQLMRIHAELERELAPGLAITDLFRYPTIRSLAAYLEQRTGKLPRVSAPSRFDKRAEALERRRLVAKGGVR